MFCELVLDAKYTYTKNTYEEIIFNMLHRQTEKLSPTIFSTQFDDRIKVWKEETTTSSSGRHLGHIHALYKLFKYKNDTEKEEIEAMREKIKTVFSLKIYYY